MQDLIIIRGVYKPNTAPINRLLSMLRGFDELGFRVLMVFLYPNEGLDRLDEKQFNHIQVLNLWEKHPGKSKWYRYFRSFWNAWHYSRSVSAGSTVFLAGSSEYVPLFARRNDLRVYHERTEHYSVVPLKPRCLQKWYLRSLSKLEGMFVISTSLRDVYMKVGAKKVIIVNMMVDSNRFKDLKKQSLSGEYIAYCGTASNNKDGVNNLIKAFAILVKSHPEVKLKIMGKAPSRDDESGNLLLVEELGIKESVEFTGVVKAEDMPQMLKNATIVALARPDSIQARCGFPTKLGEYLLSENPVVVTNVGDIPLFLKDGETALMVEPDDVKGFANKMIWAIENPEKAASIGLNGSKVALTEFNYRRESEKIINTITKNNE